jgi:hypothetical protein
MTGTLGPAARVSRLPIARRSRLTLCWPAITHARSTPVGDRHVSRSLLPMLTVTKAISPRCRRMKFTAYTICEVRADVLV